jgi:hypothetical protein
MDGDVWKAAPPRVTRLGRMGKYDWVDITEQLKSRPGEWMLVDEAAARGLYSAIVRRKMTALQQEGWRFRVTTRNNNRQTKTAEVWMTAEKVAKERGTR